MVLNNELPFFAKFLCERKLKAIEKYRTNVSYDGKCFDCINTVEIVVDLTSTCKISYENRNVYNTARVLIIYDCINYIIIYNII